MIEDFRPLLQAAHGLALEDTEAARAELVRRFDPGSPAAKALEARLLEHLEAGRIAERGEPPMRWGRAAKASAETLDFSIDVVHMSGAGPRHRHPAGEINYCIALEGEPTFVGRPPGWVVEAPGSEHVPSVEDGTMLIVYLLPGGQMEFLK
jgi:hypothetical protein